MPGTLVCGADQSEGGRRSLALSIDLAARMNMRLVVAHVAHVNAGFASIPVAEDESLWHEWLAAERRLGALLRSYDVYESVERRVAVGDVAGRIAEIAAENAADLIVIGAARKGRRRRRVSNRIADQLASETTIPVLVAVPRVHASSERVATSVDG